MTSCRGSTPSAAARPRPRRLPARPARLHDVARRARHRCRHRRSWRPRRLRRRAPASRRAIERRPPAGGGPDAAPAPRRGGCTQADDPTVDLEGVRVPAGIPKPLSEDQVTTLLDAVAGHEPVDVRDRALLELLYATGARISEVCAVSMGDIDFDTRLVRLFGKGSKERIVPYGRAAGAALDEWFSARGRVSMVPAAWRRRSDAEAVFLNVRGGRAARRHGRSSSATGDGRGHIRPVAARPSPFVRHAPPRPRRRSAGRPGAVRGTPRYRPPRCTRRSARSGCGRRTARPTTCGGAPVTRRSGEHGEQGHLGHLGHLTHLARRFATSLSPRPPSAEDATWAERHLLSPEIALWRRMPAQDRRHSVEVARRFLHARPEATRAEMAGALLHDVGKIDAGLGTIGRVVATIAGPANGSVPSLSRP